MPTDGPTEPDSPSESTTPTPRSDESDPGPAERTAVGEDYIVRLPPSVRAHLDLEPGDELRWTLTESGDLAVEEADGEWGAFEGAEAFDLGVDTLEAHDLAGHEPAISE